MADVWPTSPVGTANVDQGSDSAKDARVQILDAFQKVNTIIAARAVADGVASLDAEGLIPDTQLRASGLLAALLTVDGDTSGLDADSLDGHGGEDFLLVDGSRAVATAAAQGWNIHKLTTTDNARATGFTLHGFNTPGATLAGYGLNIVVELGNHSGNQAKAGYIGFEWTAAGAGNEDADLIFGARSNGALVELARWRDTKQLEWAEISTPSGQPPAGKWWIYPKSTGLAIMDDGGVEAVLNIVGGIDHGSLTGLSDDDHVQYMRVDGSRVLTGDLQLGAHSTLTTDLGADPTAPAAGKVVWYSKGQQAYYRKADGTVVGPIIAGGVTDHGDLTGLSADDHLQYLLRQPTADVVINESGGDFDLRWESDTNADFFRIDAGEGVMALNKTGTIVATAGTLQVASAGNNPGIFATTTGGFALGASSTTGTAMTGAVNGVGVAGYFLRSATASTPGSAVVVITDGDASHGFLGLYVYQTGTTGTAARFDVALGPVLEVNATELVINDTGVNYDLRVEGDTADHLLFLDASADVVNVNGSLTTARLNVSGGSMDAVYAVATAAGTAAILGESAGSGGSATIGVYARQNSAVSNLALRADSVTGIAGYFAKTLGGESPSAEAAVGIDVLTNTDLAHCVSLSQSGTGDLIYGSNSALLGVARLSLEGAWYLAEQATDVAAGGTPWGTGIWGQYYKSNGLYVIAPDGTITGPLRGGGAVSSPHGAAMEPGYWEELVTVSTGGVVATTAKVPVGAIIQRVLVLTVSNISGISGGYNVGVAGQPTLFGVGISATAGDDNLDHTAFPSGTANYTLQSILLTAVSGTFSGGTVRVTCFYTNFTAAIS